MDHDIFYLGGTVLAILVIASVICAVMALRVTTDKARATVANLNARTRSWWIMAAVFGTTLVLGSVFTTVLFACLSFLAMREFITLNKTERADHEVLFWAFFVIIPLHYFLVGIRWYGLFTI
ncbi:MAG: phosphatidate cytidylyltransferase, partial [Verrucomicrobiales bacterium]|nr:phosphatidate cytidylyltransferase [Verrucomicrobiales bacterium]